MPALLKKVVDAKLMEKLKSIRRLEKYKKHSEKISKHSDMTGKEKAEQSKVTYTNAFLNEENRITYTVAKKCTEEEWGNPLVLKYVTKW